MKAKVKQVKIAAAADVDTANLFNQMLGAGDPAIFWPKCAKMKEYSISIIKLFGMLADSPFMTINTEFTTQQDEIKRFCETSMHQVNTLFNINITKNIEELTEAETTELSNRYIEIRKSPLITTIGTMYSNLVVHQKNFVDINSLRCNFILLMPGVIWSPFPFTSLNLKYIFTLPTVQDNTKRFFMTILHKVLLISAHVYEQLKSPDINLDKFVDVIMTSIDKVQNLPELHRCRRAFRKIRESVQLLKERFGGYYNDFLETGDSTIMMQHFILDVSKETKADPRVTAQFRTIINFYRKTVQSSASVNPKAQALFNKFNDSFAEFEKNTNTTIPVRETDDESDGSFDDISVVAKKQSS